MNIETPVSPDYGRLARLALRALRLGYAFELLLLTVSVLIWPAPGRDPNALIWILLVFPLLLCLPAVWLGWVRQQVWLCFLILLYFTAAVTECFVPGRLWWGLIEVAACVWVFTAALCYTRWGSRAERLHFVEN